MPDALDKYLEKKRAVIDEALDVYLPKRLASPPVIHDAMRYSVFSGGKRIRPILVLESADAVRQRTKDALPLACAVELIHTYSLVHDDLPSMDNDDMRRSKPACHVKFGEAAAILAGDALLTLAFNIIAGIRNKAKAVKAISEASNAAGTFGMIGGQAMDIDAKGRDKLNLAAMEYINIRKTGALMTAAVKIGGIAAGASQGEMKALKAYGENIGLAFQIADDIADGDGYVAALGVNGARDKAKFFSGKAKKSLKIFGRKSDILKKIADFIVDRTGNGKIIRQNK